MSFARELGKLQAIQMSMMFFLPNMMLSGFIFPFLGMPRWAQVIGEAFPLTHYIRATRDILLRGDPAASTLAHTAPMLAFAVVAFAAAILLYRRRLD